MIFNSKNAFLNVFALVLFGISTFTFGLSSFDQQWREIQGEYKNLTQIFETGNFPNHDKYCHPAWESNRKNIKNLILGKPNERFLDNSVISGTMVRRGDSLFQRYEKIHLISCIDLQTKELIASYQDTSFGFLPRECREFNCTTNTLGCLFYVSKILGNPSKPSIQTIIDFGGGYGNLARVFKTLLPDVTLFIIDLPEVIALQALYLRSSLPTAKTVVHTQLSFSYESGAIHLIPVYLLENLNVQADLFVSTFALSESPLFVQNIVINKNFFDAKMSYIVGQLDGWNANSFESHDTVLNGIRKKYPSVTCQPFHFLLASSVATYEAMGIK